MQNPPNPDKMVWYVRKADKNSNPEYTVVGYEFTQELRKDSIGSIEGSSTEANFRKAFLPEEGHYFVSRDFAGQELRILANLAYEKTWIDAFLSGADIHAETAYVIWGKENFTSNKRSMAKTINFGIIYGMSGYSLGADLGIPQEEAQAYIDKFFSSLPNIKRFLEAQEAYAANNKDLANLYGRKRRFHNDFYMGQFTNAGKRQSYNFPIQSMGAEITKLALIKLYDKLLSLDEYKDKIKFMSTIHDEINFSVAYSFVKEAVKLTGELMEHKIPNGPVPITTDLAIGHSMGLTWGFRQDPTTLELTPQMVPLTEKELEKIKTL